MNWISIETKLPPLDKPVLVLWRNIHDELQYDVSQRNEISRHNFSNPPIDNRYFVVRMEINPLYWMDLPELPIF
jgi:hypothetical protein